MGDKASTTGANATNLKVERVAPQDDVKVDSSYTENQALSPGDRKHVEEMFNNDEKRAKLRDARAEDHANSQRPGVVQLNQDVVAGSANKDALKSAKSGDASASTDANAKASK